MFVFITAIILIIIRIIKLEKTLSNKANKVNRFSDLVFPNINTSKKILSTSDGYTKSLGKFDLQSKLQSKSTNLKEIDYLNNVKKNVKKWSNEEKNKLNIFYNTLKSFFIKKKIFLNFPDKINVIKTTGAGNTIIMREQDDDKLFEQLFYHEVWHIITNYDKSLSKFVYSRFQYFYDESRSLIVPSDIKEFRISNPDLYGRDVYIKAMLDNKVQEFSPIIISNQDYNFGSFFDYLYIVLFAVENKGNKKVFKKDISGNYIVLKVIRFSKNKGDKFKFLDNLEEKKIGYSVEKILGYNTPYILGHPEESLAEMFKLLVSNNWKNQKSSELINSLLNDLINYRVIKSNTFKI